MSASTTATEQRPAPRNPFSKLSTVLGLAQKPRWIQDFRIELDHKNPTHRYNPGDVLRGTVFFTPTKAVRITHITISLYGYVHVFKGFKAPGEGISKESLPTDPSRLLDVPGVVPLFTPVEETLFGDVKLLPCRGQFQFALRLPSHRLPSSIDFEKGSIQYNLVAAITRPGAISPVLRCEPKKFLVYENIDCGNIPAPKVKTVVLESVDKKKKRRKAQPLTTDAEKTAVIGTISERDPSSPRSSISASIDGSQGGSDNMSVSNSSSSTELRITQITSNNGTVAGSQTKSIASVTSSQAGSNKSTVRPSAVKVITTSAELLRGAFLPGDSIPVRVQVSHVKPVKSMCGLIVTLYRKTHIETEPVVHEKVRNENGETILKPITTDVYPKSFSGLGGLSISSKQTSQTFRMDVAQVHVPLFVDPITHKADIKTSLKVPTDGVHPTITHVRGDTLDFRYYVEICLDIRGKLEESRFLPRLTNQAIYGLGKPSTRKSPSVPMSMSAQGQQLIDTQTIRRERPQLICWNFHVVIGTKDSGRGLRSSSRPEVRQHIDHWQAAADLRMQHQNSMQGSEGSRGSRLGDLREDRVAEEAKDTNSPDNLAASISRHQPQRQYSAETHPVHITGAHNTQCHDDNSFSHSSPPPLSLSEPNNEPVDEKTRLKQQEEYLLPSQPPQVDNEASAAQVPEPSAPLAEDLETLGPSRWETEVSVQYRDSGYGSSAPGPSASSQRPRTNKQKSYNHQVPVDTERQQDTSMFQSQARHQEQLPIPDNGPSRAFSNFDFSADGTSRPPHSDDKQEMERCRLMEQRSAPDYDEPETQETLPAVSAPPALSGGDHRDAFGTWDDNEEGLPKYEG